MSGDLKEQTELDGMFMSLLQNSKEGIDGFYFNLFGFLRRKSDFFKTQDAGWDVIKRNYERQLSLYKEDRERMEALEKKKKEEKAKKEAEEKKKKEDPQSNGAQVQEVTDEEADRIMKEEAERKARLEKGEDAPKEDGKEEKKAEGEEEGETKDGKVKPNAANGAKTEKYEWGQTLDDIWVNVYLPDKVKANQLDVKFTNTKFKLGLKGKDAIIEADFFKKIKVDESTWSIESDGDRRIMQLAIQKFEGQQWWSTPFKGDEEIDTQKVEPETSKLSDLDLETRAAVEKMMFDQNQKMKGEPTSDELEKRDKLKGFMAAHPEMDFSKCKFM